MVRLPLASILPPTSLLMNLLFDAGRSQRRSSSRLLPRQRLPSKLHLHRHLLARLPNCRPCMLQRRLRSLLRYLWQDLRLVSLSSCHALQRDRKCAGGLLALGFRDECWAGVRVCYRVWRVGEWTPACLAVLGSDEALV